MAATTAPQVVNITSENLSTLVIRMFDSLPEGTRVQLDVATLRELLRLAAAGGKLEQATAEDLSLDEAFPSPAEIAASGTGEMTVKEAAELLGLTKQAVLHHVHAGTITGRRVGHTHLLSAESVAKFAQGRRYGRRARSLSPNPDV